MNDQCVCWHRQECFQVSTALVICRTSWMVQNVLSAILWLLQPAVSRTALPNSDLRGRLKQPITPLQNTNKSHTNHDRLATKACLNTTEKYVQNIKKQSDDSSVYLKRTVSTFRLVSQTTAIAGMQPKRGETSKPRVINHFASFREKFECMLIEAKTKQNK